MHLRRTRTAIDHGEEAIPFLLSVFIAACLCTYGFAEAQISAPQVPEWQTAAGGHMEFEVASIHLGMPGKFIPPAFGLNVDDGAIPAGGNFKADFPLPVYIEFAYKLLLSPEQRDAMLAHQPDWVRSQPFLIEAKAPIPNPTKDQFRLMMQSLLADRFKLAVHFETREVPALAVVLAKPNVTGPRLRPHGEGLACDAKWTRPADLTAPTVPPGEFIPVCGAVTLRPGPDQTILWGARNISMEHMAQYLTTVYKFGRPLVDRTGLQGTYDFSLNWAPDASSAVHTGDDADVEGPDFFEALKDQLGLKLESTHAPVQFLVIDHIEQPSAN
jgi:bla regulator protein blaR1